MTSYNIYTFYVIWSFKIPFCDVYKCWIVLMDLILGLFILILNCCNVFNFGQFFVSNCSDVFNYGPFCAILQICQLQLLLKVTSPKIWLYKECVKWQLDGQFSKILWNCLWVEKVFNWWWGPECCQITEVAGKYRYKIIHPSTHNIYWERSWLHKKIVLAYVHKFANLKKILLLKLKISECYYFLNIPCIINTKN